MKASPSVRGLSLAAEQLLYERVRVWRPAKEILHTFENAGYTTKRQYVCSETHKRTASALLTYL